MNEPEESSSKDEKGKQAILRQLKDEYQQILSKKSLYINRNDIIEE